MCVYMCVYRPVQCSMAGQECWCVDGEGQEVIGTRTNSSAPLCETHNYHIHVILLSFAIMFNQTTYIREKLLFKTWWGQWANKQDIFSLLRVVSFSTGINKKLQQHFQGFTHVRYAKCTLNSITISFCLVGHCVDKCIHNRYANIEIDF